MFPGLSPIYLNPQSVQTNVGPIGNDPGWSLAQSPNVTIPNIPAGATSANPTEIKSKKSPLEEEWNRQVQQHRKDEENKKHKK